MTEVLENDEIMENNKEWVEERYGLAKERLQELCELEGKDWVNDYFKKAAALFLHFDEEYTFMTNGFEKADIDELKKRNELIYQELKPENYQKCFANPEYAEKICGKDYGKIMSALYAEIFAVIPAIFEQKKEDIVIRMELLLEVYGAFTTALEDNGSLPAANDIREILYFYISDYLNDATLSKISSQVNPENQFFVDLINKTDLEDLRYLYRFGEYITDNELQIAAFLNQASAETINLMAQTFAGGYLKGFEMGGKDWRKKKTVDIRYHLGFERMIRRTIEIFEEKGLKATIYRAPGSLLQGRSVLKNGLAGANPNKQFDFDHKEDMALFLDKRMMSRKLEALKLAFEQEKEWAHAHGGPAVMEVFGEEPFAPTHKDSAPAFNEKQQKLMVELTSERGTMINHYIPGEERSFTIIDFPIPEIGEPFEKIFREIIDINTLDYNKYCKLQEILIRALNQGKYAVIKGMNGNRTNLKIYLQEMKDSAKQTLFENCLADVNIPVGEVFTTPKLEGTEGTLHVKHVFLNELEFHNIYLEFKDGMITEYNCSNFEQEEENLKYVSDNVLFHHKTLPMGEFAIGTNTKAYVMALEYNIAAKLPILIAEKMGPHFAVGDTCYSHEEDNTVYNPDGKEIIAKENTVSANRKENPLESYFNCHTDITIPYEELGEIFVVTKEEQIIQIIEDGRFVLAGCEELNEPFLK